MRALTLSRLSSGLFQVAAAARRSTSASSAVGVLRISQRLANICDIGLDQHALDRIPGVAARCRWPHRMVDQLLHKTNHPVMMAWKDSRRARQPYFCRTIL